MRAWVGGCQPACLSRACAHARRARGCRHARSCMLAPTGTHAHTLSVPHPHLCVHHLTAPTGVGRVAPQRQRQRRVQVKAMCPGPGKAGPYAQPGKARRVSLDTSWKGCSSECSSSQERQRQAQQGRKGERGGGGGMILPQAIAWLSAGLMNYELCRRWHGEALGRTQDIAAACRPPGAGARGSRRRCWVEGGCADSSKLQQQQGTADWPPSSLVCVWGCTTTVVRYQPLHSFACH